MEAGQMVTWTHVRRSGRRVNLSTRRGRVIKVEDGRVHVQYRKNVFLLPRDRVRLDGQQTELTQYALKLCEETLK